jgi:Spx/MgsR family transcriptional regulator
MVQAYGLKKCSTCQKADDWFKDRKISFDLTDYSVTPLSRQQVARWSKALGGWEKLINRSGYTWRGLPRSATENLTEDSAISLTLAHPSLIRRPLIEHPDGTVTVGFSEKVKALF